ncbi:ABC transporter permease [Antarctobacter sp.]|uniref:ABC transporter permease n=1 Tax=Antarctobacter sp. TaxID=1872577 RepID=UPI003A918653
MPTLFRFMRVPGHLPGSARVGAVILVTIILLVVLAPLIATQDPMAITKATLVPPGAGGVFGTDDLGRDVFARVLYGGRVSLLVGLFAALIAVGMGLVIGVVGGFSGGMIDEALMRFTEVFQIVPRLLVAIVVVSMVGGSIGNVIFVIGILSWPPTARLVRAQTLVLRNEDFMSAAIMSGASYVRLIRKQILGNILPILLVSGAMQVAVAVLAEASLSFLGLGDPSYPSWGQMLYHSQGFLRQAWWMSLFPGCALALAIVGLNLVSDGFSDRLPGVGS